MKTNNILYVIFIVFFIVSCNKEEITKQEAESYMYTETFTVFSDDALSSAEIMISSNDKASLELAKSSLVMTTNFCEDTEYKKCEKKCESVNISTGEPIIIDILSIKSEKKTIGFTNKLPDSNLKSQVPWINTFTYTCVENDWPYVYVRYEYVTSDSYGIFVEMGHKNCWLCEWGYPISDRFFLNGASQNNEVVANPWNDYDPVYKLSARVTTNMGQWENYYHWVSKSPF